MQARGEVWRGEVNRGVTRECGLLSNHPSTLSARVTPVKTSGSGVPLTAYFPESSKRYFSSRFPSHLPTQSFVTKMERCTNAGVEHVGTQLNALFTFKSKLNTIHGLCLFQRARTFFLLLRSRNPDFFFLGNNYCKHEALS